MTNIKSGIHVLSRETPPCPACQDLIKKLLDLRVKFEIHDVIKEKIPIMSIPQLVIDGNTIAIGSISIIDLRKIFNLL